MGKRNRKRREKHKAPEWNPINDLPETEAARAGMRVKSEGVEQHRRGKTLAQRKQPWEITGLSSEQIAAAEHYAATAHEARPSPAPKSCLDVIIAGYDDGEGDPELEAHFLRLRRATKNQGQQASAEVDRVCWLQEPCRNLAALRAGLQAVADVIEQPNRRRA